MDRAEKLRKLREQRAQQDVLKRAEQITQVSAAQVDQKTDDQTTEKQVKHRKILDTYKTGSYFLKRSNSAVDLRHESMQTDMDLAQQDQQDSARKSSRKTVDIIKNALGRNSLMINALKMDTCVPSSWLLSLANILSLHWKDPTYLSDYILDYLFILSPFNYSK